MSETAGLLGPILFLSVIMMLILFYIFEICRQRKGPDQSPEGLLPVDAAGAAALPPPPPQAQAMEHRQLAGDDEIVFETYSQEKSKEDGGGGCAICLEEYRDGETTAAMVACNHRFHAACIKAWLLKGDTCPLCRTRLIV